MRLGKDLLQIRQVGGPLRSCMSGQVIPPFWATSMHADARFQDSCSRLIDFARTRSRASLRVRIIPPLSRGAIRCIEMQLTLDALLDSSLLDLEMCCVTWQSVPFNHGAETRCRKETSSIFRYEASYQISRAQIANVSKRSPLSNSNVQKLSL
jgi:hypothetical protein